MLLYRFLSLVHKKAERGWVAGNGGKTSKIGGGDRADRAGVRARKVCPGVRASPSGQFVDWEILTGYNVCLFNSYCHRTAPRTPRDFVSSG